MKLTTTPRNALGQLPRCTHQVTHAELATERRTNWRKKQYGEGNFDHCTRRAAYTLDGKLMCGLHTGATLITRLLNKDPHHG